jgi:hypothetical protein
VPLSDCRYCPDLIPPDHVKLDGHGASSLADIEPFAIDGAVMKD